MIDLAPILIPAFSFAAVAAVAIVAGNYVALQARIRDNPAIELAARREWAKMCRAIPLGRATPGVPDLWLEVRPVRAVAAQPRIDAAAVTLTVVDKIIAEIAVLCHAADAPALAIGFRFCAIVCASRWSGCD